MTSFSNLILVYDKEKRSFVEKFFYTIIAYTTGNISLKKFLCQCAHIPCNLIVSIGREYTADPVDKSKKLYVPCGKVFADSNFFYPFYSLIMWISKTSSLKRKIAKQNQSRERIGKKDQKTSIIHPELKMSCLS